MIRTCPICRKTFDALTNKEKYCSKKCSRYKKYYKPKPMLRKICKECKKIFFTRRSIKIFCSTKCKDAYHYTGTRYKKVCRECHKLFTTGKTYQFYCSKKCYRIKKNERSKKEYQERRKK